VAARAVDDDQATVASAGSLYGRPRVAPPPLCPAPSRTFKQMHDLLSAQWELRQHHLELFEDLLLADPQLAIKALYFYLIPILMRPTHYTLATPVQQRIHQTLSPDHCRQEAQSLHTVAENLCAYLSIDAAPFRKSWVEEWLSDAQWTPRKAALANESQPPPADPAASAAAVPSRPLVPSDCQPGKTALQAIDAIESSALLEGLDALCYLDKGSVGKQRATSPFGAMRRGKLGKGLFAQDTADLLCVDRAVKHLLSLSFKAETRFAHDGKCRAMAVIFRVAPTDVIERIYGKPWKDLEVIWMHYYYLHCLQSLGVVQEIKKFYHCEKAGLARSLWRGQKHRSDPPTLQLIASLCLDFHIADASLLASVLTSLLAHTKTPSHETLTAEGDLNTNAGFIREFVGALQEGLAFALPADDGELLQALQAVFEAPMRAVEAYAGRVREAIDEARAPGGPMDRRTVHAQEEGRRLVPPSFTCWLDSLSMSIQRSPSLPYLNIEALIARTIAALSSLVALSTPDDGLPHAPPALIQSLHSDIHGPLHAALGTPQLTSAVADSGKLLAAVQGDLREVECRLATVLLALLQLLPSSVDVGVLEAQLVQREPLVAVRCLGFWSQACPVAYRTILVKCVVDGGHYNDLVAVLSGPSSSQSSAEDDPALLTSRGALSEVMHHAVSTCRVTLLLQHLLGRFHVRQATALLHTYLKTHRLTTFIHDIMKVLTEGGSPEQLFRKCQSADQADGGSRCGALEHLQASLSELQHDHDGGSGGGQVARALKEIVRPEAWEQLMVEDGADDNHQDHHHQQQQQRRQPRVREEETN